MPIKVVSILNLFYPVSHTDTWGTKNMYWVWRTGSQGLICLGPSYLCYFHRTNSPFQIIQHFVNIIPLGYFTVWRNDMSDYCGDISCSLLKLFLAHSFIILTNVSSSTVLYAAVPYSSWVEYLPIQKWTS